MKAIRLFALLVSLALGAPSVIWAHGGGNHGHQMEIIDPAARPIVAVTIVNKTGFSVSLTFVTSLCDRVILKPGESRRVADCFRKGLPYATAIVWYTDTEIIERRVSRDDLAVFRAEPNAEWVLLPAPEKEERK